MRSFRGWANPDDGSVVAAEAAGDHWVFSTVWAPADLGHPVSGNREFGFTRRPDGSVVFHTRGADRATSFADFAFNERVVFPAADKLWRSFQDGVVRRVNAA